MEPFALSFFLYFFFSSQDMSQSWFVIRYPGEFKHSHLIPPEPNRSNLNPYVHGDDKQLFLEFV